MLDVETRRRIDTARDILVGKVPDPKSQVEQITIALIYKFMWDIEAQGEELGGKRSFFVGNFARFAWPELMHPRHGGQKTLDLYHEALTRIPENPGIPPLFRNIFNNAYLPYRDPETLREFLKVIDQFEYDHSERLGDAFEYLLSIMGAQGDAGQFRTPRHIIDFIVEIVNPQLYETVLDPACSTAGFLISAFKHIQRANTDADGQSTLTPHERGRLAESFTGYDISPDMVRLSLVNMYLHGFVQPDIHEYDTLTSDERWDEYADVILANPPFMSPRGGIRPHNRFSVQARRSEVLFVDYMVEHLTPTGRAGIIVPEGIIFQSQKAHTQLRKMLVEDYLVAVVSLPAGVFKPYSGVKTSILILDRALARRVDHIALFKVQNDGFDLGDQRRPVDTDDLPLVRVELTEYLRRVRAGESLDGFDPKAGLVVEKERVARDGDYNLGGERYRDSKIGSSHFPMVRLGDVADLIRGITFRKSDQLQLATDDSLLVATTKAAQESGIDCDALYHIPRSLLRDDRKLLRHGDILISTANSLRLLGRTTHVHEIGKPISFGAFMSVIRANSRVLDSYLFRCLRTQFASDFFLRNANTTTNISNLNLRTLAEFCIPLPPLAVQQEIVAEIEGYQKVIDGARAVIGNYHPRFSVDPNWPMVPLGKIVKPEYGFTERADERGDARFIRITDISENGTLRLENQKFITLTRESRKKLLSKGDILVARTGATYGKTMVFDEEYPAVFASYLVRLRLPEDCVLPEYYWAFAQSELYWNQANGLVTGGGQQQFNGNSIKKVKLPIPPLDIQKTIVRNLEAERALIGSNHEIDRRFEQKTQEAMDRLWNQT